MALRMTEAELLAYDKRLAQLTGVADTKAPRPKAQGPSKIERRLAQQIDEAQFPPSLPPPQRNYFFLNDRDLEFDFAFPSVMVAVEVQGMAHRIKGKFQRDIEKRALAQLAGWRVLEVDGASIRSGKAIGWLKELLWQMTHQTP